MLYCLTEGLYNDMAVISKSQFMKTKTICGPVLELPEDVDLYNKYGYLFDSIKAARKNQDPLTSSYTEYILRVFKPYDVMDFFDQMNRIPLDCVSIKDNYNSTVKGQWKYTYACVKANTVYVSTEYESGYCEDGKYIFSEHVSPSGKEERYSLSEIAMSHNKDFVDAVIPPDPSMFTATNCLYKIPVHLL